MTFLYIILSLLFALYLWGCWVAYRTIKNDRAEYSLKETIQYTLGSWLTVVIGVIGRVQ